MDTERFLIFAPEAEEPEEPDDEDEPDEALTELMRSTEAGLSN